MKENFTIENVKSYVEGIGDYIEPYNLDILLGLTKLTNSIEEGYKLYIKAISEYSFSLGNTVEDIKKDILYRSKENLPIKFLYETDRNSFINTVKGFEGIELEYYLKMNGYKTLSTGISICI